MQPLPEESAPCVTIVQLQAAILRAAHQKHVLQQLLPRAGILLLLQQLLLLSLDGLLLQRRCRLLGRGAA